MITDINRAMTTDMINMAAMPSAVQRLDTSWVIMSRTVPNPTATTKERSLARRAGTATVRP